MKTLITSNFKECLLDDDKFDYLNQWSWNSNPNNQIYRTVYINEIKTCLYIYGLILDLHKIPHNEHVDHKDRNKLNNQLYNLRPATYSQNQANRGLNKNNTSGYKGVSWHNQVNKFRAYIKHNKIYINLGLFDSPIDAALAYDRAALRTFGEFAVLNFPLKLKDGVPSHLHLNI